MGYIHVDIPAIKQYLSSRALKQADVCTKMGRSRSYISACGSTGKMSSYAYTLRCRELGVAEDTFIRKEMPKSQEAPPEADELYSLRLRVSPSRVILRMYFQDTEIYSAVSKVKGTRELDLLQAVSYAAHMMYKFAEQKELNKEAPHA